MPIVRSLYVSLVTYALYSQFICFFGHLCLLFAVYIFLLQLMAFLRSFSYRFMFFLRGLYFFLRCFSASLAVYVFFSQTCTQRLHRLVQFWFCSSVPSKECLIFPAPEWASSCTPMNHRAKHYYVPNLAVHCRNQTHYKIWSCASNHAELWHALRTIKVYVLFVLRKVSCRRLWLLIIHC